MKNKEDEFSFFVYADQFYFAATQLESSLNPRKIAIPAYYLYAHSIELSLKGYLFKQEYTIEFLKNEIRHDLEKALNEAQSNGINCHLDVSEEYLQTIKQINAYYSKKELEYMGNKAKEFPLMESVKTHAKSTISALFNEINGVL